MLQNEDEKVKGVKVQAFRVLVGVGGQKIGTFAASH